MWIQKQDVPQLETKQNPQPVDKQDSKTIANDIQVKYPRSVSRQEHFSRFLEQFHEDIVPVPKDMLEGAVSTYESLGTRINSFKVCPMKDILKNHCPGGHRFSDQAYRACMRANGIDPPLLTREEIRLGVIELRKVFESHLDLSHREGAVQMGFFSQSFLANKLFANLGRPDIADKFDVFFIQSRENHWNEVMDNIK